MILLSHSVESNLTYTRVDSLWPTLAQENVQLESRVGVSGSAHVFFLTLSKKQTSNSENLALAKVYDSVWELFTCIISILEKALVGTTTLKHWFELCSNIVKGCCVFDGFLIPSPLELQSLKHSYLQLDRSTAPPSSSSSPCTASIGKCILVCGSFPFMYISDSM